MAALWACLLLSLPFPPPRSNVTAAQPPRQQQPPGDRLRLRSLPALPRMPLY